MEAFNWNGVNQFFLSHQDTEATEEEAEEVKSLKFEPKVSHEAKVRELLRNIVSSEIKLCSYGVKEFKKCLKEDTGGEFLSQYVRSSPNLSELMEAWRIRQKNSGLLYILSLITAILDHPDGKYTPNENSSRDQIGHTLDKFSKLVIDKNMDDLYKELNSKEGKRQKVALLLLAAIVRRGSLFASEVANIFDFKMLIFPKLAEYRRKGVLVKRKVSTRGAFIEFAVSFLEVGQPRLLSWILQQREMFSGVLRGLGNDDQETAVLVLSTLRDRVLNPESLVGPGLRSVLFGSVTLEQLANISGRESGGLAAKVAHGVLMMVCIDPANGLMPDFRGKIGALKGNPKRLIDLMKKLKPTEDNNYHKELLLAVVGGRPSLAATYLDNFPFNLEDHKSPSWFSAVSLAADLISSVSKGLSWGFLDCCEKGPLSLQTPGVQTILKCVCPRTFSRAAVSKGLQNKAFTIQRGTLRFLLESLKLLDSFNVLMMNELSSLKHEIQNEVRNLLPDPQLLFNRLNLLKSLRYNYEEPVNSPMRPGWQFESENLTVISSEKVKNNTEEDDDILIAGVSNAESFLLSDGNKKRKRSPRQESEMENDLLNITEPEDPELLFHCQLLEACKIYHRTLHSTVDVSYDIFKIVPGDLMALPSDLLRSLLPLLLEHIGWSSDIVFPSGIIPPIYNHLQSFVNLLLYPSNEDIKQQAYLLAQAAMLSTGAFDVDPLDIKAWFLFLPGYAGEFVADQNVKLLKKFSQPVVSFLCNAVTTVGNHPLKYWDELKRYTCKVKGYKDGIISFTPLVVCILEKCLQVLRSESGTFNVPDKTLVSLYVCHTLKYLLETQVECHYLSYFIHEFLSKENVGHPSSGSDPDYVACEWRPLKDLLLFSAKILPQDSTSMFAERKFLDASMTFTSVLGEVENFPRDGSDRKLDAVSIAFYSSLICTNPDKIPLNLSSILEISEYLYGFHHALLAPLLFLDQNLLVSLFRIWPKNYIDGIEMSGLRTNDSHFESAESASIAFGAFLKYVPFHFLFPSIIFSGYHEHHSQIKELLLNRLSNMTVDQLILSLRLVLFWVHQIQLSYKEKPSDQLQHLSHICYEILEHTFGCLMLALKSGTASSADRSSSSVSQYLPLVAEIIFSHPVVAMSFSTPLEYHNNVSKELPQDSLEEFLSVLGHGVHEINLHSFNLPLMACDLLLTHSHGLSVLPKNNDCMNKIMKAFAKLVKQIFLLFKEKFDLAIKAQDPKVLFPVLYAVLSFLRYIPPFELLELAHWTIYRVNSEEFIFDKTSNLSPICMGFLIAAGAFKVLDNSVQLSTQKEKFGVLFEGIYQKAVNSNLHSASLCLVEALNAVSRYKCSEDLIFLSMEMVRVISMTPIRIITHCRSATNGLKSKILLHLIKLSSLHMLLFGHDFLKFLEDRQSLSDEDYLMLLPAALMYFSSAVTKLGEQYVRNVEKIPSYARILLEDSRNWKSFVSQNTLELECGAILTSSHENLLKFFRSSLLGNAILILKKYFSVGAATKDEGLMLIGSKFLDDVASEDFLDFDVKKFKSYPVNQLLNLINRAVAKVSLCQALLLKGADDGNRKFVTMLLRTWKLIVKKVPSTSCNSAQELNCYHLIKFLEIFILGSIADVLVQLDPLPSLTKIVKYSFRYRFGDSATFKLIRSTISSLLKEGLSSDLFLQLLLGHSQLALSVSSINDSSVCQMVALSSRPISSIFAPLVIPSGESSCAGKLEANVKKLEIIKLLRTLYHLSSKKHPSFSEPGMGRELHFLLLSSYGATMSEVDLEIYAFMREIESSQGISGDWISENDYLWGSAVVRIRKELEDEQSVSIYNNDNEMEAGQRKSRFRENLLIDHKFCVATVLNFPFKRTLAKPLLLNGYHEDYAQKASEANSENSQQRQCYDPVFILQFSIHCLSMEFLNPVEFAGLGLLAVALVSISSPDEGIRKLGYKVFGKFKDLLEKFPKKKDVKGLKLLLTYLPSGIEDPWQKIPSIHAIFAAEASLVLLDPSHGHYTAINNYLMKSPRVNLKSIPFFDKSSSSIDFKANKQWMLHLLYSGINLEDDAPIFLKKSVFEILLSSYTSPLSDTKSKELILQVVKKSVKIKRIAHRLVQDSGLILWLSSILPSTLSLDRDNDLYLTKLLVMLLEVATDAFSFRKNVEWLKMTGFEQLSDLSSRLVRILVSGSKFVKGNSSLVISVLEVVMKAMKISMERNIHQAHVTLSFGCLYKLYQTIVSCRGARYSACAESGLTTILLSAPPVSMLCMDNEELSQFLVWAASTAWQLDLAKTLGNIDSQCHVADLGETSDESFTSKLLRWLVASVILGSISSKRGDSSFVTKRASMDSLPTLMKQLRLENWDAGNMSGSDENLGLLAAFIFHLQQLLGTKCRVISSAVAALTILLSCSNGFGSNVFDDDNPVSKLWSKIPCPPEADPAWRWSYFEPLEEQGSKISNLEDIDEVHTCQRLMVTISSVIQKKSSDSNSLSLVDLEGAFEWERGQVCNRKRSSRPMKETRAAKKLRKT